MTARRSLRLKYTCEPPQAGSWGEEPTGLTDTVACVRVADFDRDNFRIKPGELTLRDVVARDRARGLLRNGDLLIEKSGGGEHQPVGAVAQYDRDEPAVSSNFLARIRARPEFHPRFLAYVHASLYSSRLTAKSAKQTTGIQNLDLGAYLDERFSFPGNTEQQRIAEYLDQAANQIDRLLVKKQRLIELLDEKHRSLINRAVTQGIDPTAPMKDTGLEWLTRVPRNWKEYRLSGVADFVSGSTPSIDRLDYWNGDIPWASAKDMKVSHLQQTEDYITHKALTEWGMHLLKRPTVLLVVRGMILAHSLPVAISQVPMTINQDMKALVTRSFCSPEFLMRWFQGSKHGIAGLIEQSAHGTRCLRTDLLKQVRCFLPSLDEQAQICRHIAHKAVEIEDTITYISTAIDRLQEYRSALITAAVTGQLDIRAHEKKMEALA